jgi:LDH2 family malate/lactate/ureidoglycolate dehydrogenase
VAIATGPEPGTCWVMTEIVVHYHVGIRRYAATNPYELAVCAKRALVDAAMTAAETAD